MSICLCIVNGIHNIGCVSVHTGVQPSMQPPQMVGQSAQGMAGMQKPVASTMMHSPMTAPQHFHQSKRQRYTRNVQPPTHMLNPGGHNTQLTQAPGQILYPIFKAYPCNFIISHAKSGYFAIICLFWFMVFL